MPGLEDHRFRFTSDELFNGLPAQLVDKWSAWGVKAAVGYNIGRAATDEIEKERQREREVKKKGSYWGTMK